MQYAGFDFPDEIRLGVAISMTVRGIHLGQPDFEISISLGRFGMIAQVIPKGDVPLMFVTALLHNVEVVRVGIALPLVW